MAVADHLITKYQPGVTEFEELVTILNDRLMKIDQKRSTKKVIKQVIKKEAPVAKP